MSSITVLGEVRYIWLSESYRAGWRSNNEGVKSVEIIDGFLGLEISRAAMLVEINFLPPFRVWSLVVTLLGLITGLLLLFVYRPKSYRTDLIVNAKKSL